MKQKKLYSILPSVIAVIYSHQKKIEKITLLFINEVNKTFKYNLNKIKKHIYNSKKNARKSLKKNYFINVH